jgi:simple sugar transport system permease protein
MGDLFQEALIVAVFASTLRGSMPMLLAALGETYGEASGILNLGIEGLMIAGAFSSFLVGLNTDIIPLGFLTAAIVGASLGLLIGFFTITLGVNQIVVGLAITIFSHGACSFLHRVIFGNQFPILFGAGATTQIPLLSKVPVIGPALFDQHWLLYVTLILVPILYYVLFKTRLGLRIRAVGETPWAADVSGVNVYRIRYFAIILAGILGSLGGAFLAVGDLAFFVPNMVHGRGFIAIVVVMLGKWNPIKVLFGALLFGFALSLTSALQVIGVQISPDFILMLPYFVVILTLFLIARTTSLPAALCIPYERGEK